MTCVIGIATYWWIVDFPENSERSFRFVTQAEKEEAVSRIERDRGDVIPAPFSWAEIMKQFLDLKVYGFALTLFCHVCSSNPFLQFLSLITKIRIWFRPAFHTFFLSCPSCLDQLFGV